MNANIRAYWIWNLIIQVTVTAQCNNLQTCYQCGVACKHNETTGISQSDCFAHIDQTSIHVAEYHPSETKCVLGSCTGIVYKVPINGILGIFANLDVRSFRYSCVTDCPVFEIKEEMKKIKDTPTDSHSSVSRSDCITMCLDTAYCYMWDHFNSVCYMHADCAPTQSCSKQNLNLLNLSHKTYTRSCLSSCGDPEAPVNGTVTFTDTTTNSVASFSCNDGFVEATGSNTQTCLSDGSWSSPQPLCEASGSLTSTSTSSSDSATSLTTTTATTSTSSSNIENTSAEPKSPVKIFIMPCICYKNQTFIGKTQEEIISMLIQETKINPKNTAFAKSKLISRNDLRPSSRAVGFAGLGLIVLVFGILVLSDAVVAVLKLKEMIVNGAE
ncbi:uncharacterized protein LOC123550009 [Mercenaria mercenaria]|uniref:uncharacterized protein LOC123550009 n=1 Tax=Mercenaria mercenaria TaxID=6596 RepID=UPI001E1DCDC0|nr:uncharacterized protein LOC123550009 [Mercenaria mercenaria]